MGYIPILHNFGKHAFGIHGGVIDLAWVQLLTEIEA